MPESDAQPVGAALEASFGEEIKRRLIDRVSIEPEVVIVAIVGEGMRGTPGVAARLFGALAQKEINVIAIAQGSSECSISLVVAADQATEAVRQLHEEVVNGK